MKVWQGERPMKKDTCKNINKKRVGEKEGEREGREEGKKYINQKYAKDVHKRISSIFLSLSI